MTTTLELTLTSMTYGGNALGRVEGKVIFVPYALPHERVRVEITQDKGKFAYARLLEVIEAAPERTTPRCIHFGTCGGCHWQHARYEAQLHYKQAIVQEQLTRLGGLPDVPVHPTLPSADEWGYRTHVTVHHHDQTFGFVGTDDRTVIPITECHIIRPPLWDLFEQVKANPPDGERLRLQVGNAPVEWLVMAVKEDETTSEGRSTAPHVIYTVRGKTFQVAGGSFFQVNLAQAEVLIEQVLAYAAVNDQTRVMDIYAGVGLFTWFLAQQAAHVTAIEVVPRAVMDMQANLADLGHVEIIQGAAEEVLPRHKGRYDVIVVDPPRVGLKPTALEGIIGLDPTRIVYVSCDPSTMARDLKAFVKKGYRVMEVQPVDMFPQTYHIECVALLTNG